MKKKKKEMISKEDIEEISEKYNMSKDEILKSHTGVSTPEQTKKELKKVYNKIIELLKEYLDLREDYYSLIAVWIIGTYFHKEFSTYPYLFLNAMKKSGKTRALKLISHLAKNGKLLVSMSEAVLFRTAKERTLCIDEFERIGSKEKQNLRELLNAAYKKGINVERLKKSEKGDYEVEEFEVYCPVVIANIWGMENVLSDRCIQLILERSNKQSVTKLIENFDENLKIKNIVSQFIFKNDTCDTDTMKKLYNGWNLYVQKNSENSLKNSLDNKVSSVISVNSVNSVNIYNKINKTGIEGRDLELFLPLYIIASFCGEDVLNKILETSTIMIKEKREVDREESRDTQLIEFVSQCEDSGFISVAILTHQFKEFIECDDKWLNNSWLGRALRRLVLIKDKHRTGKVREVKLNIEKAKQKYKIFKIPMEKQEELEKDKELPIKYEKIDSTPINDENKGNEEKG